MAVALSGPPVFIAESGILPLQSTVQHTKEKGDGVLHLYLYKGRFYNSYTYYEDDGDTYSYENGVYYERVFQNQPSASRLVLHAKQGSYPSKFSRLRLHLHGFQEKDRQMELTDGEMIVSKLE